jgi:2-methylcitrate dehydratase PrpD
LASKFPIATHQEHAMANPAFETIQDAPDITRQLAANIAAMTYDSLPADVVFVAKHCLLDWLGVTMAGAHEPLTGMLVDHAAAEGGAPQATIIGLGGKVSVGQAALINGSAGHALDYDDVLRWLNGHPTAPVMPAILALAEHRGDGGRALIEAFVAGVETESRIGIMMGEGHYAKGWHATATIGHFGAAAGAAKLLDLDRNQIAIALGIAGTQAAGLKSMFGTMCKPMHAGKAAQNGLFGAQMAARGFTSRTDVLETSQGFGDTQTDTFAASAALEGLGERYLLPQSRFKYHAACYGTHGPIDAAAQVRANAAFDGDQIERIEIRVLTRNLRVCNIQTPATGLEAKFSLRFTVSLALLGVDTGRLDTFDDAIIARRDVMDFCHKARVTGIDDMGRNEAEIIVHQHDGTVVRGHADLTEPVADLDATWARLQTKFRGLSEPLVGARQTQTMLDFIENLESAPSLAPLLAASYS